MGIMTDRIAYRAKLLFFLVAVVVLTPPHHSAGQAEDIQPTPAILKELEEWHEEAAKGNTHAQVRLGMTYAWFGPKFGIPLDDEKALYWYRKAAEQGEADAQHWVGRQYEHGLRGVPRDNSQAAKWYRLSAEQGDVLAQTRLAALHFNGDGVLQDYHEALRWYRAAAMQGWAEAQSSVAAMYHNGEGVPQDYREALRWYRAAAMQGKHKAQFNLAVMYHNGDGEPQDLVKAHAWMNLAATSRYDLGGIPEQAAKLRDSLQEKMTPDQVAEAQRLAAELFKQIESSKPK